MAGVKSTKDFLNGTFGWQLSIGKVILVKKLYNFGNGNGTPGNSNTLSNFRSFLDYTKKAFLFLIKSDVVTCR